MFQCSMGHWSPQDTSECESASLAKTCSMLLASPSSTTRVASEPVENLAMGKTGAAMQPCGPSSVLQLVSVATLEVSIALPI